MRKTLIIREQRRLRQATNPAYAARRRRVLRRLAIIRRIALAIDLCRYRSVPHVRPSRRVVLVAAGVAAAAAAALALFDLHPSRRRSAARWRLAAPEHAKELVALVRPAPVVYFPGLDGQDRRSRRRSPAPLRRREASSRCASSPSTTWRARSGARQTATATSAPAACCGLDRRRAQALRAALQPPGPPGTARSADRHWTQGYYDDRAGPDLQHRRLQARELGAISTARPIAFADTPGLEPEIERLRAPRIRRLRWQFVPQAFAGRAHRAGVGWRR